MVGSVRDNKKAKHKPPPPGAYDTSLSGLSETIEASPYSPSFLLTFNYPSSARPSHQPLIQLHRLPNLPVLPRPHNITLQIAQHATTPIAGGRNSINSKPIRLVRLARTAERDVVLLAPILHHVLEGRRFWLRSPRCGFRCRGQRFGCVCAARLAR